jgi:hypothetical protein
MAQKLNMPFQKFTNVSGNRLLTRAARIAKRCTHPSRDREGAVTEL